MIVDIENAIVADDKGNGETGVTPKMLAIGYAVGKNGNGNFGEMQGNAPAKILGKGCALEAVAQFEPVYPHLP